MCRILMTFKKRKTYDYWCVDYIYDLQFCFDLFFCVFLKKKKKKTLNRLNVEHLFVSITFVRILSYFKLLMCRILMTFRKRKTYYYCCVEYIYDLQLISYCCVEIQSLSTNEKHYYCFVDMQLIPYLKLVVCQILLCEYEVEY